MISVIIPVLNEIDSLPELMDQLRKVLHIYSKWEILFVDDGSTDGSTEFLYDLSRKDENVTLIQFHRNYGKSAALAEGFKLAEGEFLITMDADLQDDPAEIPNLMKKLEEGFDLVSGWKKERKDPLSKRLPSKIFNYVTRLMTGVKIHDFNCGLKIYRKSVTKTHETTWNHHIYMVDGIVIFQLLPCTINFESVKFESITGLEFMELRNMVVPGCFMGFLTLSR